MGDFAGDDIMTDDERIELLAQALWTHVYGVRHVTTRWRAFADTNSDQANQLRAKAKEMLHTADSASAGVTKRPHSSLGWLA